jgi:hypothetical protein
MNGLMGDKGLVDAGLGGEMAMASEVKPHSIEQCVPLESLGVPGDGELMESPEVGDRVDYTVEGKVTRIEGGKAYVMPEAVNGKPVADATDTPPVDEMPELEKAAGEVGYLQ